MFWQLHWKSGTDPEDETALLQGKVWLVGTPSLHIHPQAFSRLDVFFDIL